MELKTLYRTAYLLWLNISLNQSRSLSSVTSSCSMKSGSSRTSQTGGSKLILSLSMAPCRTKYENYVTAVVTENKNQKTIFHTSERNHALPLYRSQYVLLVFGQKMCQVSDGPFIPSLHLPVHPTHVDHSYLHPFFALLGANKPTFIKPDEFPRYFDVFANTRNLTVLNAGGSHNRPFGSSNVADR